MLLYSEGVSQRSYHALLIKPKIQTNFMSAKMKKYKKKKESKKGKKEGWMDRRTYGWTDERTEERAGGWMDARTDIYSLLLL